MPGFAQPPALPCPALPRRASEAPLPALKIPLPALPRGPGTHLARQAEEEQPQPRAGAGAGAGAGAAAGAAPSRGAPWSGCQAGNAARPLPRAPARLVLPAAVPPMSPAAPDRLGRSLEDPPTQTASQRVNSLPSLLMTQPAKPRAEQTLLLLVFLPSLPPSFLTSPTHA